MRLHVISYFSPNYAVYAGKLAESLRRWSIPDQDVTLQPVPAFRSWHDGVSYKPLFIQQMLNQFTQCDGLLWLDADACLVRHLPLGELKGADIAASRFQWSPGHALELLTGTMFFAVNNKVRTLVGEWVEATKRYTYSDTPEQDSLLPLINAWKHTVAFEALPIEWAFIDDDRVRKQFPKAIPIVLHSQASRHTKAEEARAARK